MFPLENVSSFDLSSFFDYYCPMENDVIAGAAVAGVTLVLGTTTVVYYLSKKVLLKIFDKQLKKVLTDIHFYSGNGSGDKRLVYTDKCIELLKAHPHLVNVTNDQEHGYTPFLRACWNNNYQLIKFMLKIGANINIKNQNGESPLYLVTYSVSKNVSSWDYRALNLLANHPECRINDTNSQGNTALHIAVKGGHVTLVLWLLVHGAFPAPKNNLGFTPVKLAMSYGTERHLKVASLLRTAIDVVVQTGKR